MASRADSSALSVISEESGSARKHHGSSFESPRQKIKSAYGVGSKKKLHPLMMGPGRQNPGKLISLHSASKNNLSEFTQRIMSAKLLRVKQMQNQLSETQMQLNELMNENRILRNMQKRQEGALKRYEGNHAELPQMIRAHNEEIRTLKSNNKVIKAQLRESNAKLKERENELENLRDSYNKLKKLSTEKNLLEREKLQKKVEDLQETIKEQEEKIQVLSRKILLESKNYRHHLNVEILKHKETQKDLNSALTMISRLECQIFSKDKSTLPTGKVLLKRDNKSSVPIVGNKSMDIQPKVGISEDSFLSRISGKKVQIHDSPESELEFLLNESLEDTPSPTQDIFPSINENKKITPQVETTIERTFSKSELHHQVMDVGKKNRATPIFKKPSLSKRNKRFPEDLESNAKVLAEKINEEMESIEDVVHKVEESSSSIENKGRLSSLFEDDNESSSKLESERNLHEQKTNSCEKELEPEDTKLQDSRRSVPKRKLEENKLKQVYKGPSDLDVPEDLAGKEQFETITKTWNTLKSKIQEDRKKAEEKLKELNQLNNSSFETLDCASSESDHDNPSIKESIEELSLEAKKELRFINFTDDAYILQELEKTDKIFNKLKNESKKASQKTPLPSSSDKKSKAAINETPKPKPRQQSIKSFRTESQREPKYLEEFQTEYQKQNLIKALRAIDSEKDPNFSADESGDSEPDTKKDKFFAKNSFKQIHKVSSEKTGKDLLTQLFGTRHNSDQKVSTKLEGRKIGEVHE